MEEEIGKIASDTRADKARERQYHEMAQQFQQWEQNEKREEDLRKEEIAEPNEDLDDGRFNWFRPHSRNYHVS